MRRKYIKLYMERNGIVHSGMILKLVSGGDEIFHRNLRYFLDSASKRIFV